MLSLVADSVVGGTEDVMARLDGKVAIVTGGARGMGAEQVRVLVGAGAKVVFGDVLEDGKALADELGDAATFMTMDVTSEEAWAAAVETAHRLYGPVTILVNNAGICPQTTADAVTKAEFEKVLAVNLIGPALGVTAVVPDMKAAGGGSIVNISSAAGLIGMPYLATYVATKFGLTGYTKSAALDLGHYGIRVNSVHPGAIRTPMAASMTDEQCAHYAIPRMGGVDDIAAAVLYLASDDAKFVTGAELAVDGGMVLGSTAPVTG